VPLITCGIDWASDHHDIALVDADGRLVAKRRIPDSVSGFDELLQLFADAREDEDDLIPVAIETPRGLLVAALRATGRPIYPINPMAVARYRERTSMSGKKSDHADAIVLANILRTDAHAHRRLPADTHLAQSITVLARAHQDAAWRRGRAAIELRSLLREYFPVFLQGVRRPPGWDRRGGGPRSAGGRTDTGQGSETDQTADPRRPAPCRSATRPHHLHRRPAAASAFPAVASSDPGRRHLRRPGSRVAGNPGHRMRQPRSPRPRDSGGVRAASRLPDHHLLRRRRRHDRRTPARRDR